MDEPYEPTRIVVAIDDFSGGREIKVPAYWDDDLIVDHVYQLAATAYEGLNTRRPLPD